METTQEQQQQAQSQNTPHNGEQERRIVVIGITGGIGSGKSAVADYIREAGYVVFSSDATAKRLINENAELRHEIKQLFGLEVFQVNGLIDEKALAAKVFGDTPSHTQALNALNTLVHPQVFEEHRRQIEECAEKGEKLVFLESALIYEAGIEDAFDYIIVVDAPEEVRIQRVMQRGNSSEEQVRRRMKQQISANEKKNWADFVIDNSSTPEKLREAVNFLLPIVATLPPSEPQEIEEDDEAEE